MLKSGQFVTICDTDLKYMFLGYVNKTQCMLADRHGNTHIQFLERVYGSNK